MVAQQPNQNYGQQAAAAAAIDDEGERKGTKRARVETAGKGAGGMDAQA